MMILYLTTASIVLISSIIIMILNLVSKKSFSDREKSSPFECGFDPKSSSRLPFSLQFFLIAVIFLIFDVEITLLFPLILMMSTSNLLLYSISITMFIIILLLGMMHEWKQGALDWIN